MYRFSGLWVPVLDWQIYTMPLTRRYQQNANYDNCGSWLQGALHIVGQRMQCGRP